MLIIVIMACMIVTFFFVFNHSNFSNSRIETKDSYTVFFIAMIIATFFFVFNLFTGKEIEHEEEGRDDHGDEEDGVRVLGFNAAIAKVAMVEHEEEGDDHAGHDHDDEHGDKVLEVIGVSKGSTDFVLQLMHGDHADYTSTNNVPVVVK